VNGQGENGGKEVPRPHAGPTIGYKNYMYVCMYACVSVNLSS